MGTVIVKVIFQIQDTIMGDEKLEGIVSNILNKDKEFRDHWAF